MTRDMSIDPTETPAVPPPPAVSPLTLRGAIADMRADLHDTLRRYGRGRLSTLLTSRGFHALAAYRLARWARRRRVPLVPLLLGRVTQIAYAIDLHPLADIRGGVSIVHGVGVVIGPDSVIEPGTLIYHGVTLGLKGGGRDDGFPHVEADCVLGTGATLLGHIRVGRGSIVGPKAVLTRSVPPRSIVKAPEPIVTPRRGGGPTA